MRGPILSWLGSWGVILSVIACGGEERLSPVGVTGVGGAGGAGGEGPTITQTGTVIVGVISDFGDADYHDLHVIMRVDGAVVDEQTYGQEGEPPIAFPMEIVFSDRPQGAEIEVEIRGKDAFGMIPFERLARTTILAGENLLLRVRLMEQCMWSYGDTAVTYCDAPLTCSWGKCGDPHTPSSGLETYSPSWASYSYCKPPAAGEPVLALGTGRLNYAPVDDFDVLTAEAGGQGGHHVWLALRMKNLRQTSFVTLAAHVPDLNFDIGPYTYSVVFAEAPASGYCEHTGIVFRVDEALDVSELLGLGMQVRVRLEDEDGVTAVDTRSIALADTIVPL